MSTPPNVSSTKELVILEGEEEEEEVNYANNQEFFVVQQSLSLDRKDEDQWLQTNILHTRYTSQGKVYDVIIDGGSCKNVMGENMVDQLKLKTKPYSQPYKLTCFCMGVR